MIVFVSVREDSCSRVSGIAHAYKYQTCSFKSVFYIGNADIVHTRNIL